MHYYKLLKIAILLGVKQHKNVLVCVVGTFTCMVVHCVLRKDSRC